MADPVDEHTAAGMGAAERARARRLCMEAKRACGHAAALAGRAGAARDAAGVVLLETEHALAMARITLREAAAATAGGDLDWLLTRRERLAKRAAAARPRPADLPERAERP